MDKLSDKFNIEDLLAYHNVNIDEAILRNENIDDENSLFSYVKLEASESEDCQQNNEYLKVEFSFAKHYNSIGQNIKAYVTILNDSFEELNNVKCVISSEDYFNTYTFIINSIQINEVVVKEVNLTIYDKYLNLDNYNMSFDNSTLIENLIDNLPNNVTIKLIDENQDCILPSYPSVFNITSDFFIKDFLKINETNEIFNVMILGPSLEASKNFTNSLKLLFENYNKSTIDFTNDETIKNSFIENYLNNEQWPLNIRIFYNKNYNHINQNHKENTEKLNYIMNGYFPNDNSIVHLTEKNSSEYNVIWNKVETCQLDESIENMKAYNLYNNSLPKNNKQYINAFIILLPLVVNTDMEVLQSYKEIADILSKKGRPVYIVLDNFINNSTSESSLTEVNDSKEEINFMNIINEFSLYPIFSTSSYELINTNNDNEGNYNVVSLQRFRKNMNRDILLLHMMNKMTKDLIEINRNQKMLINPEKKDTNIIIILYWDKNYDQHLSLIPTVIGECYSNSDTNRMALISNINRDFDIDFTNNRLDYFKKLSSFDINSMKYENIDFEDIISKADTLLRKTNSNNNWNIWIISNTEISNNNIKIIDSKFTGKTEDKIYYVDINEKQDIGNLHNDNLEITTSNISRFLTLESIDSLIEYFSKNTKKSSNIIINPRLTLK